jgi:hypothetical protein
MFPTFNLTRGARRRIGGVHACSLIVVFREVIDTVLPSVFRIPRGGAKF